jgi:hypothetical protein
MDPRRDTAAWIPGQSFLIIRNEHDTHCAPAFWDGQPNPLKFNPATGGLRGLNYFPDESYITCIGDDVRPWMNSSTFVGINCLYGDKIVWFLVDTDQSRDTTKRPFGFDLIPIGRPLAPFGLRSSGQTNI